MTKPATITDLRAADLSAKIGLSRSYAYELIHNDKKPSLDVAVKIEREFGVPVCAWIDRAPRAA